MPVSPATLRRLAEVTAPVLTLLTPGVAVPLPPAPALDLASVTAWWFTLSEPQVRALLATMPASDLAAQARLELDPPAVAVAAIPRQPGLETLRGDPHVDRDPIWDGLKLLLDSEKRVLLVNGETKHGKSRTVDLVKMFVEVDAARRHQVIDLDLDGLTFDAAMRDVFLSFEDEEVPRRDTSNSADEAWLKLVAKAAHKRALAGPRVAWFVFDHVERLRDFNIHVAFFNRLLELIVESRHEANAPRVVLIDRREAAVNKAFKWPVQIAPLTAEEIADFLLRRDPALARPDAVAQATTLMAAAHAAATAANQPAMYMDYLKRELAR